MPKDWQDLPPLHQGPPTVNDLFVYDRDIDFKLAPNLKNLSYEPSGPESKFTVTTHSLGFNGIGFRDDGISGEPVNVAVGDSFTFCWASQENCWVELLEQKSGQDFVNMGTPGYGGFHEVYILEHYALKLQPHLLIWEFYVNDLYDNIRQDSPVTVDSWTWLERRSVTFSALRHFVMPILPDHPALSDSSWPWILDSGTTRSYFYYKSDIGKWLSNLALQEGWAVQQASLLQAKHLTVEAKAKLVVVLFPYREQLYFKEYQTFAPEFTQEKMNSPYQLMRDFCQKNNIEVLDLCSAPQKLDS